MGEGALSGTTVIDLSQHITGSFCARLLADFGATVIKVEPPGEGGAARHLPPFPQDIPNPEKSGLFVYLNNNKYGITLNLESPKGRQILRKLIAHAQVVVEDFPPGKMKGMGFGYDELQERFPGLVIASITPFGQWGPYSEFRSEGIVLQAMGGWMDTLGEPDREPLQAGGEVGYFVSGYVTAVATTSALYLRNLTGVGQHIDLSLMEAHLGTQQGQPHGYFMNPRFLRRRFAKWYPGILKAKDGYVGIHVLTDLQWEYVCEFMGTEDLLKDPRLRTHRDRQERVSEMEPRFQDFVKDKTRDEVFYEGMERRIPMAMVYSVEEMLSSPKYVDRGFFVKVEHPSMGEVQQPGAPFKLTETPWTLTRPAPLLGQHNYEIYPRFLNLDKKELDKLAKDGVI